jgi:hydrogenase maturation protein HypF
MKICKIYEVEGRVQGVGFRPFVFGLASEFNLKGVVFNRANGVYIEAEGEKSHFVLFEHKLRYDTPPLARVDAINIIETAVKNFDDFKIEKSQNIDSKNTLISPDMSICKDCEREMRDYNDRRFDYPLINCTNCGPRYSIVHTVPYDRVNTSMNKFHMCPKCEAEYNDPLNRRYHAQPISCPNCGPKIEFNDLKGGVYSDNPIQKLADLIMSGKIGALKGMGGFHIVCDALNEQAILSLREKKRRKSKPFAVLFNSIDMIKTYCYVTKEEEEALLSQARPITLVKKKKERSLPEIIAPNIDRLGVFLPYTPLHLKLLRLINRPVIATSANISGEPIITSKEDLIQKLGHIMDGFVDFDRDIVNFSDDSVLQFVDKRAIFLRLSRGLSPKSFKTNFKSDEKILALGAHQKNAIAIFNSPNIIISPHIGDLDSVSGAEAFEKTIASFKRFYDFEPSVLVCDKHSDYYSSMWAKKQNIRAIKVQHHYAHILAIMFEQGLSEEVLGVAWDGAGLGDDNSIWGGEFFLCDIKNYKRVHTFAPFKLLGGDKSVKNIERIAFSILYPHRSDKAVANFFNNIDDRELLEQSYAKNINTTLCHSVGRLFDAAAAIIFGIKAVTYEGESGLMMESLYDDKIKDSYEIAINEKGEIEYSGWFLEMLREPAYAAATKFINTLALVLFKIAVWSNKKVILSGGVFQNRTLIQKTAELLNAQNIEFFTAKSVSPNDSSIALGQLVYALNHM